MEEINELFEFCDSVTLETDINQENTKQGRLECNRLAAHKFRERKKQLLDALKKKQDVLSNENKRLHSWVNQLNEEIYQLKAEILTHKGCESPEIDLHIQTSAIKIMHKKKISQTTVNN